MAQLSDTTTTQPSLFAIFRNRNFSLLWSGQTLAEFGNGFTTIAASILVFRETGSAMSVGLMLMATSLPGLVFGLIAGVFVDRLDRQRLMVTGQIIRTVLILLIPVLLPYGVGWLYVLVMTSSTPNSLIRRSPVRYRTSLPITSWRRPMRSCPPAQRAP